MTASGFDTRTGLGPSFFVTGLAVPGGGGLLSCALMDDERLIELETRFAYLEDTVRVLNEVVARQQREIDQLEQTCRQLADRLARSADSVFKGTAADEVPPHW